MTKARVNADNASADIQGVTAGTGLTGGGTSGTVTITNDMATAIDAKGDLVVGTGADTYDNLAVGSNGDTIVADSSTSTGLRYQGSMAAGRNFVINGGMDIWQRSTSVLDGNNQYATADRWTCSQAPQVTFSRQVTGDTTNLPFIQYCMRLQRTSGGTQTNSMNIAQSFETVNSIPLAGKTVTLSFYARKGANYSATSSVLRAQLITGTGTDQNVYTVGYTGSVTAIDQNATLTTTWQRFSYTVTLATNTTEIGVIFIGAVTGTAGAADYFDITGIQLEVGSVATQFSRAGGTIQGELAACQRYYQKSFDQATAPANAASPNGQVYFTRQASSGNVEPTAWIKLAPSMRTAPSVTLYNPYLASPAGQWSDGSTSSANARTINGSDSGFTIDNADVAYSTSNYAIHYAASAEL